MITKFRAPKLSANVEEATVTAWFKQEGDLVEEGEALIELTTDKTAFEVESPCSGTLRKTAATIKSIVPVGYILALIGDAGDALPEIDEENSACMAAHREASGTTRRRRGKRGARKEGRKLVRATPAARRAARELGVELAAVQEATGAEVVDEEMVRAHADSA